MGEAARQRLLDRFGMERFEEIAALIYTRLAEVLKPAVDRGQKRLEIRPGIGCYVNQIPTDMVLNADVVAALCFAWCDRPLRGAADARACHEAAVPPVTASLTELPGCCHQIPGLDAAAVPVARSTTSSMFHWTTDLPGVTVPSPGLVAAFDRSSRAAVEPPGPPQTSHVPMRL